MKPHVLIAVGLISSATLVTAALAGPEEVDFPRNYAETFHNYGSVDRESNPAQIGELFANDVAVNGLKRDGELPIGSVLIMEVHNAQMGEDEKPVLGEDNRRIKTGLGVIAVMEKCEGCGEEYPQDVRNGNWEFAFFNPETHELVERDYAGCFTCHKPMEGQDFVFSLDRLKEFAASQ